MGQQAFGNKMRKTIGSTFKSLKYFVQIKVVGAGGKDIKIKVLVIGQGSKNMFKLY